MTLKLKLLPAFLFAFIICTTAIAQNDSSFLNNTANKLSQQPAIEKVYLHLDKPGGYSLNDTIWYKAYTTIGQYHQLSTLSGVLYVELINPKDSVVTRQILHLNSGTAHGDIPLAGSLKRGSYRLRAYTNWMRNLPGSFYDVPLRIGGVSPVLIKEGSVKNPDIQFFPEGGALVVGVRSKVAIKSVNANGLGEDVQGTIEDNDGNVVANFTTQHLGMGVFPLTPQSGKTYKAKIKVTGETSFSVDLPKAEEKGYTLALNNSQPDSIFVKIAVNEKTFDEQKNNTFYVIAQNSGKVYYSSQGKLANLVYIAQVDKKRFPAGITQFTLFSQNGEPLAERIAFVRSDDTLKLNVNTDNQVYATRGKVKLSLQSKDGTNAPVMSSLSIAVINESHALTDESAESTIINHLLLSSDLKGYIEKANYYFVNTDDQKLADLDILMLTQGYRNFVWKQVLDNNHPEIAYKPEQAIELSGELKTSSGKPVSNGKVILVAPGEKFIADTVTDLAGKFRFSNIDLSDTSKTVLRARKSNNSDNVSIYVKQPNYPVVKSDPQKKFPGNTAGVKLTPEMIKNLQEYQAQEKADSLVRSHNLSGVTIKTKKISKPDKYNAFGTAPERYIDMTSLRNYFSIYDALRFLLPKRGDDTTVVVVDGLEVYNQQLMLPTYLPSEIQSVKLSEVYGYNPEYKKMNTHYVVIETKRYAGTDTTMLKEVKIIAKKSKKGPEIVNSANLNGPGNADQIIMADNLINCVRLSDCLEGKVFGVTFNNGEAYSIRTQNRLRTRASMAVIIDGTMLDGDALNNINPADVYSIEVLRSGSFLSIYGSNAPGGALVITTKRAGDASFATSITPAGLITYPFKGYFKAKAFYVPKYDHPKKDTDPLDRRTTVYWNPNVITDKEGKASFEYFNNDAKGIYRVVVEGIDDNGNLGRQVYRYKVE